MRTTRLGNQHPLLILPKRFRREQETAAREGAFHPGMAKFWPWCYRCNKRVVSIEQVSEGAHQTTWEATHHGEKHAIVLSNESQLEERDIDPDGIGHYAPGAKVKFLTFFAPESYYGASDAHWNEGRK